MANATLTLVPAYDLDTDSGKQEFRKVGTAIDKRDYKQAVEQASIALTKIKESAIITILDHRAYALGMDSKFDQAIKDAQDIIALKPTFPTGYLRLGEIYQSQGKQSSAIEAYDVGLQSVSVDHPYYPQIVDRREEAVKKSRARVDFVARLPVEIVDDIITLIPTSAIPNCLMVSGTWQGKIFKCPNAWKNLRSGDGSKDDWTTSIISHIAANVENLTIDTTNHRVLQHYIHAMNMGEFTKVKTLRLDGQATKNINTTMVTQVSGAFWGVHDTLTKLVLDFHEGSAIIAPGDLLSVFSNLKCLEYSTEYPLSELLDERIPLKYHDNLVDMWLVAKSITDKDLQKLRSSCQHLRRLLLRGCDTTVLDIVDRIFPNLETFGYNAQYATVAQLDSWKKMQHTSGLCRLYTYNGGTGVPLSAILPLIWRNMHSLEVLYVNLSGEGYSTPLRMYDDLTLKNLNQLTFWGDDSGIVQPFILRSISTCTDLTQFATVSSRNIPRVVKELVSLPQLERFEISHPRLVSHGEKDLIRLFERYARNFWFERRLKSILLRYCKGIVTDDVLNALAGIRSLESIWFAGSSGITENGFDSFFMILSESIFEIRLSEMNIVTDRSLKTIGKNMKNLERIILENLKNVSDHGITRLIDGTPKLQKITIVKCKSVTQRAIAYAKRKVKSVVVTQ